MSERSGDISGAFGVQAAAWLAPILDQMSAIIYIKDAASRHLYVNSSFERLFGVSRASVLGKTNAELFPAVADVLSAHDRRVMETGGAEKYEERLPIGTESRVFSSCKLALRDAAGSVVGVCCISLDVTDRRRTEARLRQEEEITRRLVQSSADGILAFDRECRYTVWNPRMERISGLAAAQVLGRCAFDVFPFLVETGEDGCFRAALEGRETISKDRPFTIPESGREGFFEGRYSPLHDADGRVIGGLGVIIDITERRRAEQERLAMARTEAARAEAEEAVRRSAFLAEAGEALSSSLDYEQTLRDVARLALPVLGDLCIVDVVRGDQLERVATTHVNVDKVALLDELRRRYPPSVGSPQPAARVFRSGEPQLLASVSMDVLVAHTLDAEHAELIRRIGMRSHLAVPLIARGSTIGVISLGITESERRYEQRDVALAMDLARRAALAVDNARLYRTAREELAERRRVEEALRISEGRFRAVMEQAPLSTQVFARDGRTLRVNKAWEQLWGVTLEHLADYNVRRDPQLEARGIAPYIERAFTGEAVEIPAIRYDPEETIPGSSKHADPVRWVRAFAYPIKDARGTVQEVVLVHEDVSASLLAAEQLRQSEERSRVLADAGETLGASLEARETLQALSRVVVPRLADFCFIDLLDEAEAAERVAVFHSDPARLEVALEMFRAFPPRKSDAYGPWPVMRSAEPEWIEQVTPDVVSAIAHEPRHSELFQRLGVRSWLCVPIVARGNVVGALTLAQADSGRRQGPSDLELAMDLARRAAAAIDNARLYQRLRDEDRRKDEFLATLAHELRNPLAPLRSGLDVLKAAPPGISTVATRAIMERQLAHMVRLIDDLLDVSRVTRGKIELHSEVLDLEALVNNALEVSGPAIQAAGLRISVRLPQHTLLLRGDRTRLAQVLSNLLNNAAKYARGGDVVIEAERDGEHAVIRVKDTGQGIPTHMLEQVFDMFVQVERADSRGQGGLGIGLTLVRRLVELHGGRVWAESAGHGRGSTFVIRLPALPASPARAVISRSEPPPSRAVAPLRVLVVDDNADAAELLSLLIQMDGHDVRTALNGPAALEVAAGFRPELAFLDIGMPGMNGYELGRHLRDRPEPQRLHLVAVTGWGQEEDRRRSQEAGFEHHLTKPVDVRDVRAIIEALSTPSVA